MSERLYGTTMEDVRTQKSTRPDQLHAYYYGCLHSRA